MIGGIATVPNSVRLRGTLTSTLPGSDKKQRVDMVQCVHCLRAWPWVKGSMKLRGFCQRCMGFICGPKCETCVHYERLLENLEAGMPFVLARQHQGPTRILVCSDVPKG